MDAYFENSLYGSSLFLRERGIYWLENFRNNWPRCVVRCLVFERLKLLVSLGGARPYFSRPHDRRLRGLVLPTDVLHAVLDQEVGAIDLAHVWKPAI